MNRLINIRIINLDDWYGFYIDGKLVDEGHSLRAKEALLLVQKHMTEPALIDVKSFWVDGELDEFGNSCPENWSDLSIYEGWVE